VRDYIAALAHLWFNCWRHATIDAGSVVHSGRKERAAALLSALTALHFQISDIEFYLKKFQQRIYAPTGRVS
jgi:hypothetical protein